MLNIFKKTVNQDTVAAICTGDAGIALAQIRRDENLPPVLTACGFRPVR